MSHFSDCFFVQTHVFYQLPNFIADYLIRSFFVLLQLIHKINLPSHQLFGRGLSEGLDLWQICPIDFFRDLHLFKRLHLFARVKPEGVVGQSRVATEGCLINDSPVSKSMAVI